MGGKLTLARITELFDYDREAGVLYWRERPLADFKNSMAHAGWNGKLAGKAAGCTRYGYVVIGIDGKYYRAHRIIWFIETGEWPLEIDHDNGRKNDNRFDNLIDGDHVANMRNIPLRKTNKSGHHGVVWEKAKGLWAARIPVGGKLKTLGRSKDIQVAIALRKQAEAELGYHANHGRAA